LHHGHGLQQAQELVHHHHSHHFLHPSTSPNGEEPNGAGFLSSPPSSSRARSSSLPAFPVTAPSPPTVMDEFADDEPWTSNFPPVASLHGQGSIHPSAAAYPKRSSVGGADPSSPCLLAVVPLSHVTLAVLSNDQQQLLLQPPMWGLPKNGIANSTVAGAHGGVEGGDGPAGYPPPNAMNRYYGMLLPVYPPPQCYLPNSSLRASTPPRQYHVNDSRSTDQPSSSPQWSVC